ncbi:MAG: VanW family protein [Peptococcaceae bacterium]|nr:VanW family protein [Peptococcaceae bacterium]
MYKRLTVLAAVIAINTVLAVLFGWSCLEGSSAGKILPGITIAGVTLGGMSPEKAEIALREKFGGLENESLILEGGGRQWKIPMRDIGAVYDYGEAVKKAYAVGRSGSLLRRISEFLGNRTRAASISLLFKFDREALEKELEKISREYTRVPRSARLVAENKKVKLIPSEEGLEMDLAETMNRIEDLQAGVPPRVVIASRPVPPQVGDGDLSGLTDVLAECVTPFEDRTPSRIRNMARSADRIDGILVDPGEVFSFNRRVSPIDERGGYEKAPIIIDDRLVNDYGGGVCQVSTTLYWAVLLSGLEIVERHAHSRPVKYVSPGLDATVADGLLDLRFRNNLDRPVYISASADPEEEIVRVAVIGKKEENTDHKIEFEVKTIPPEIVTVINPSLRPGRSNVINDGSPGFDVMVYRVTLMAGGGDRRELISDDYYPPEPRVVEAGPPPGTS